MSPDPIENPNGDNKKHPIESETLVGERERVSERQRETLFIHYSPLRQHQHQPSSTMATARTVKDVSPHEFVKAYSAHLKRSGKV